MSDTPKVEIGQVWQDYDIRQRGAAGWRLILVIGVHLDTQPPVAYVVSSHDNGQRWGTRRTRIRLDRFKPTSTGYRLLNRDMVDVLKHAEVK